MKTQKITIRISSELNGKIRRAQALFDLDCSEIARCAIRQALNKNVRQIKKQKVSYTKTELFSFRLSHQDFSALKKISKNISEIVISALTQAIDDAFAKHAKNSSTPFETKLIEGLDYIIEKEQAQC